MALLTMTYPMAMAASLDRGNQSASRAGRKRWNRKDGAAAEELFERLLGHCDPTDPKVAEALWQRQAARDFAAAQAA